MVRRSGEEGEADAANWREMICWGSRGDDFARQKRCSIYIYFLQFDRSRQPFSKEGVVLLESLCTG
jgi:hypothetical protein